MRKHIVTGAMGTIYFVLLSGIYLVAFGSAIGLRYWQWGVLSAGSSFVLVLQLLSAQVVRQTGSRRTLWFIAAMAARLLRGAAVGVALGLFSVSPGAARAAFIILLIVSNCFEAIAVPPWYSRLADIIPQENHGSFWGRRSAWIAAASLAVIVPIGFAVDRLGGVSSLAPLGCVFAFGLVIGVMDLIVHRTIPEPPLVQSGETSFWRALRSPLVDREFRPWLVFNGAWTFAMTLGGSLATVYFVEDLGIKRNFLGGSFVLILLPLIGTMVTGRWTGRMVDRHGIRRVMWWGHIIWASLPFYWIVATPRSALALLGISSLVGGVGCDAASTASGKLVTRLRAPEHVPMYMAVSTCIGSLAGGLGGLACGLTLTALEGRSWSFGGHEIVGFHIVFAISLVLRALATTLIVRLPSDAGRNAAEPAEEF